MTDLVFQPRDGAPRRLIVLLHGVGSCAADLAPIARRLSDVLPEARLLVPEGFQPFSGGGSGRQWFSIDGVTPANRSERVEAALPDLLSWIEAQRVEAGVEKAAVSLFGFSQGSIMALAASARGAAFGSVVAVAGRLVDPVVKATPASPRLLLLHGLADPVIPVGEGQDAARRLAEAGYAVEFRTEPGHGHGVSPTQVRDGAAWIAATPV